MILILFKRENICQTAHPWSYQALDARLAAITLKYKDCYIRKDLSIKKKSILFLFIFLRKKYL